MLIMRVGLAGGVALAIHGLPIIWCGALLAAWQTGLQQVNTTTFRKCHPPFSIFTPFSLYARLNVRL
jgi:hypothetical protein